MSYQARVVADSIAPHGVRLTTLVVTFPRFILAELNTHRMLSRNSASSRAIPPEKLIRRVREDPFVPETFGRRVKGMGVGEALDEFDQDAARRIWIAASQGACMSATSLLKLDVDKSRINRLLEPYLWHTALVTATEWDNFFALRQPMNDDPVPQIDHGAQPEFQIIARMMRDAIDESSPELLDYGDWHLPFVSDDERVRRDDEVGHDPEGALSIDRKWAMVSGGRCFVVSYDRLDEIMDEEPADSEARAVRGKEHGHWSPLEHPAMAAHPGDDFKVVGRVDFHANLRGWCQLRKFFPGEDNYRTLLETVSTGVPEPSSRP